MAVRLTGWLERTFAGQLLLGRAWLQDKNLKKERGVKSDPEREWRGLYHDNGSSFDITNDIHPDHNSFLQVIQLSPLVLTDGQTQVNPRIASECLPHFVPSSSLGSIVAVRKYTIRYTSYGPPRDKLQFLIHAVERVGVQSLPSEPLESLWSEEITDLLRQLDDTRAAEDRRCLCSNIAIEEDDAHIAPIMEGASDGESQSHSQYAFGTQIAHPIRPRPLPDEPQVLGVRSLEPILAGNTQREDIPPRPANASRSKQAALLDLLKTASTSNTKATTKSTDGFVRPAAVKQGNAIELPTSQLPSQLPEVARRRPTQTHSKEKDAVSSSPQPPQGTKRVRQAEAVSSRAEKEEAPKLKPVSSDTGRKDSESNLLQKLASECSWMKDFEFSREALKVPIDQLNILSKEHSWHKPQAGNQFPAGNVPITILTTLHRMADESAALEAGPDSDDEMDEDPSPEDPVDSVDPSPEFPVLQTSPDDPLLTSQVSWSQSPSPEPPKTASRFGQLPPDSSFESPEANNQDNGSVVANAAGRVAIPVASSNEKEQSIVSSSPPDEPESPNLDDEMELEEYIPQGLGEDSAGDANKAHEPATSASPLSRPVVQVKETPYVKGKNGQLVASAISPLPATQNPSSTSKNASSGSIIYGTYNDANLAVPDKDLSPSTTHIRATTQQGVDSTTQLHEQRHQEQSTTGANNTNESQRPQQPNLYQATMNTREDDIVINQFAKRLMDTCKEEVREKFVQDVTAWPEQKKAMLTNQGINPLFFRFQQHAEILHNGGAITEQQGSSKGRNQVSELTAQDVDMADATASEKPTGMPPLDLAQADTLSKAITKSEKIRSPSLSDRTPISAQMLLQTAEPLATPISPNRDEQLNMQSRSENVSLSNAPSLTPGSTKRKLENSPSKRSIRHPKRREIKIVEFGDDSPAYANPALTLRQQREESFRKFREDRKSSTCFKSRANSAAKLGVQQDGEAMEIDLLDASTSSVTSPTMSPRHVSLYEDPGPIEPAHITAAASPTSSFCSLVGEPRNALGADSPSAQAQRIEIFRPSAADTRGGQALSIFDAFKVAYPEYTGDAKHFHVQCTQMLDLEKDDKMVPKWQWDDFIVRNKTEYTAYAVECVEEGGSPVPYHRFYKDTIRDTLYNKGIIEGPATLEKAIKQFGVELAVPQPSAPTSSLPQKEKRPRASLPSAFNQPKAILKIYPNHTHQDRQRHSLPARPPSSQQTPVKSAPKIQTRTPAQQTPRQAAPSTKSTRKPSLLSRISLDGIASRASSVSGDVTEGTSDPYRDYFFAHQRLTSLTGSTKVNSRLPWPRNLAVRPSVADAPKRKIDVLKWGDEL